MEVQEQEAPLALRPARRSRGKFQKGNLYAKGAPFANSNASKQERGAKLTNALIVAMAHDDWRRVREGCEKVAEAVAAGEEWALRFVFERLEGKPHQSVSVEGASGNPLFTGIKVVLVAAGQQEALQLPSP